MATYYPAVIHKDPDSDYGVSFPDFPGTVTAGFSLEEALVEAAEALQLRVDVAAEDGEELPGPTALEALVGSDPDAIGMTMVRCVPPSSPKRINISIDSGLLEAFDMLAAERGMTRSGLLAEACRNVIHGRTTVVGAEH